MKSLAKFLSVLLVVLLAASCSKEGGGCPPETPNKCKDGKCHECCIDKDCEGKVANCANEGCNPDYLCECLCTPQGDDCSRDPGSCCQGLACDPFTVSCTTKCTSDAECTARTEIPYYEDLECQPSGICDFLHCSTDLDCPPPKVCSNGDCVTKPSCDKLASCKVVPASAVTQQGTAAQFSASAYLTSKALAPGMAFQWSSSDSNLASVNADGLVTGQGSTGKATITATVDGCPGIHCEASVTNYGAVQPNHTRVVVADELSGNPVVGAAVVVGAQNPVNTDANGVADFNIELSSANPQDVTVWKNDYHYITLRQVKSNDVIAYVGALNHLDFTANPPGDVAGGIRGKFDFSKVPCELPMTKCEVGFGLAGLSIPGNLVNLNFDLLIGGMVKTTIEISGTQEVELPSGLVLCLNQTCFKEFFSPTGVPGTRVGWGLGGKIDFSVLLETLGPILSGGSIEDIGKLVAGLLPLFNNFYTALVPNLDIAAIPYVVDFNDLNMNDQDKDTQQWLHCSKYCGQECPDGQYCDPLELTCKTMTQGSSKCPDTVPDYDNFKPQNMTLKIKMNQKLTFVPPADLTPKIGGGFYYDAVIVLAGVIIRDAGLVPLGLNAGMDSTSKEDLPNGVIDGNIEVNVADVAGRIPEDQVQRVVVALALNAATLTGSNGSNAIAGQVIYLDKFEGTYNLAPFMAPTQGLYQPATRHLEVSSLPSPIDYVQVIFDGDRGSNWHVLGEWTVGGYDLPQAPTTGDRSDDANFVAIKLNNRQGTIGYQDLVKFNDTNLVDLVELVQAFSLITLPEP